MTGALMLPRSPALIRIFVPSVCLSDELYLDLPPFERHGAPCLANMQAARTAGFGFIHFPVEEFVRHEGEEPPRATATAWDGVDG